MPKIKAKCTAKETVRTIENPTRRLLGVTVFSKRRHLLTVWPQQFQLVFMLSIKYQRLVLLT